MQSRQHVQGLSPGVAQRQLDMLRQQIIALEATLGALSTTHLTLMYYENPVTLFPALPSSYVSNTVAQSLGYFSGRN